MEEKEEEVEEEDVDVERGGGGGEGREYEKLRSWNMKNRTYLFISTVFQPKKPQTNECGYFTAKYRRDKYILHIIQKLC